MEPALSPAIQVMLRTFDYTLRVMSQSRTAEKKQVSDDSDFLYYIEGEYSYDNIFPSKNLQVYSVRIKRNFFVIEDLKFVQFFL